MLRLTMLSAKALVVAVLLVGALTSASWGAQGSPGAAESGDASARLAEEGAGPGAVLWRAGDREGALASWNEAFLSLGDSEDGERARLAYNIGVAHHRAGDALVASAWFEAALKLRPRWDDAATNRDIARADAGLEPRERGLVGGYVQSLTRSEAGWLAFLGSLAVLLLGLLDAFRGGGFSRGPWLALLALPILWLPLLGHLVSGHGERAIVIKDGGAALFGAPESNSERLGELAAGEESAVADRLPGWIKVSDRGEERWAKEGGFLVFGGPSAAAEKP